MNAPRLIVTRPSLSVFFAEPVLLGVWAGKAPRPEDVSACMASAFQQAKAAKRCAMIVAIHPDMPLPDSKVREVVQAEMKKLDPYLICGATVLGHGGLLGTAMRAVTSTLQLLTRPSHPERIVGSGREAAAFVHSVLVKQGGSAPAMEEILTTYEQATRQVWIQPDRARRTEKARGAPYEVGAPPSSRSRMDWLLVTDYLVPGLRV